MMNANEAGANPAWESVLRANRLKYPSESVVRFLAAVSSRHPEGSRALDIGFGSAQHLRLLAEWGYKTSGTEMLASALKLAMREMKECPQLDELILGDLDDERLQQSAYSIAIAWGVVFLKPRAGVAWNLAQAWRLLLPGGDFCVNFRTKDNWFASFGEEIEPGFVRLDERAGPYAGTEYCFLERSEIENLCRSAGFDIVNLEGLELWKDGMSQRHSWIVAWLRKPL